MKLTRQERSEIEQIADKLKTNFGASEVILYGSAARETMNADSDIDLLVVLPQVTWEIEKEIADLCFDIELEMGRVISILALSENDFRHSPLRFSPVVLNAHREGQKL